MALPFTPQEKRVTHGMKFGIAYPITVNSDGSITYGTGIEVPTLRSWDSGIDGGDTNDYYADDQKILSIAGAISYGPTLTVYDVPATTAALFGFDVDADGTISPKKKGLQHFALGYIRSRSGSASATAEELIVWYNLVSTGAVPLADATTDEDSPSDTEIAIPTSAGTNPAIVNGDGDKVEYKIFTDADIIAAYKTNGTLPTGTQAV